MGDKTTWDYVRQRAKELKKGEYVKKNDYKEKVKTCAKGEEMAKAICEEIDKIWDYLLRDDDY